MKKIAKGLRIGEDYERILPPETLDISPTPESMNEERVTFEIRVVRALFPKTMTSEEIEKHTTRFFQELKLNGYMTDGVRNPTGSNGSLVISGAITKADAARLSEAYLAQELEPLGVQSFAIKHASSEGLNPEIGHMSAKKSPGGILASYFPVGPRGQFRIALPPLFFAEPENRDLFADLLAALIGPVSKDQQMLFDPLSYFAHPVFGPWATLGLSRSWDETTIIVMLNEGQSKTLMEMIPVFQFEAMKVSQRFPDKIAVVERIIHSIIDISIAGES